MKLVYNIKKKTNWTWIRIKYGNDKSNRPIFTNRKSDDKNDSKQTDKAISNDYMNILHKNSSLTIKDEDYTTDSPQLNYF